MSYARNNWLVQGAVQGDSLNSLEGGETDGDARYVIARAATAPILNTEHGLNLVHIGAHVRYREVGDEALLRFRTRPLNGRGQRWIDAGAALAADSDVAYGVEFAAQHGPFGVQAEQAWLSGETPAGASFDFSGGYVDLFWSLTGESRAYRALSGSFGAVKPAAPVTQGGPGHWMLAARYDVLDLSDAAGGAARGRQDAVALGVDWVPVEHVRLKLNLAHSEMDRTLGADETANIMTLRTQLDF